VLGSAWTLWINTKGTLWLQQAMEVRTVPSMAEELWRSGMVLPHGALIKSAQGQIQSSSRGTENHGKHGFVAMDFERAPPLGGPVRPYRAGWRNKTCPRSSWWTYPTM